MSAVRRPLWATFLGLWAERLTRAFWPLWAIVIAALAAVMMRFHEWVPVEGLWASAIAVLAGSLAALWWGLRAFEVPRRAEAMARLDQGLQGRPLQTLRDAQVIGDEDDASRAVWDAHQDRMAARARDAKAVAPDLRVAAKDPFALRYVALLAFAVAALFGSIRAVGTLDDVAAGGEALAMGPVWEGWVEPPIYTGLPTLYLADQPDEFSVVEGSRIVLRFYGDLSALSLSETLSGAALPEEPARVNEPAVALTVTQSGILDIGGVGGRNFALGLIADAPPIVAQAEGMETSAMGEMKMPFRGQDDFGVRSGTATFTLDIDSVDRRFGLARAPEARDTIEVPLPMPVAGGRDEFVETLVENFSEHPWSNLPVVLALTVQDDLGQSSKPVLIDMPLPGRRFFDPLAASIIEQRRSLLWTLENGADVAQQLRAVTYRPDDVFRSATQYLRMRTIQRRLETFVKFDMTAEQRDEIAQALWDLAVLLEDGDINDALERLQRAQDRLSEAMRNGASDQEIAELMQELREATDDYLRQLTQQAQRDAEQQGNQNQQSQNPQNQMQMTQNDLQDMMDRIQELMEQGRMAEAAEALRQLQELMENMEVAQGQQGGQGQQQQSPGQQAMEGLAETLREQQGLSDQAFRDLQEQFNPNAQQGQSQGNEGRDGGQGRGQSHSDQGGEGQGQNSQGMQGQGGEQKGQPGQQGQDGAQSMEQNLAERQQALREELGRQQGNLPGQGTEAGDAAREALERAERSMQGAEDALRSDNLPEAIDRQADAMEALREGMRNLGEAMAEQQNQGQGQQSGQEQAGNPMQRDPLSDPFGQNRGNQQGGRLPQGEIDRSRELQDDLMRRMQELDRPETERDYFERLIDRF